MTVNPDKTGDVDYQGLTTFCGGCCYTVSCYTDWPECFGCMYKGEYCCMQGQANCCKCPIEGGNDCCLLCKNHVRCIQPQVCVKGAAQCFCYDVRCALPCDKDEVPCHVACCFLSMFYQWSPSCSCCTMNEDLEKMHYEKSQK